MKTSRRQEDKPPAMGTVQLREVSMEKLFFFNLTKIKVGSSVDW